MVPSKRVEAINKFAKRMTTTSDSKAEWTKWGMELEASPKQLTGRLLDPESIFMAKEFKYKADNADWTNGDQNAK